MGKNALDDTKFFFRGKEHDLLDIIGPCDFFDAEKYGKPIVKKFGIIKLKQHFGFATIRHNISWLFDHTTFDYKDREGGKSERLSIGAVCSVVVSMEDPGETVGENEDKEYTALPRTFEGEGEANFLNTTGIGQKYLQAMAAKRAESRAVLNYLGIDAYGEDEAYDFKIDANEQMLVKKFIAGKVSEMASAFDPPLEGDELRKYVQEFCELKNSVRFDSINSDTLFALLLNSFTKLPDSAKEAYLALA